MLGAIAEFVERPGGEVFIGFALMAVGAILFTLKIPKGEDAIVGGFTLIGRALVGRKQ